jgi:hypothetical protein
MMGQVVLIHYTLRGTLLVAGTLQPTRHTHACWSITPFWSHYWLLVHGNLSVTLMLADPLHPVGHAIGCWYMAPCWSHWWLLAHGFI